MLKTLTVSNLAIVERIEAEFAPGLTVITGETGAGKSVLMGALDLVLGGRAEASVVRDGAREAEVEADFGETVVRRTVTAQGRSRAWVNDESVSVAELKELGRRLIDIHGPSANQRLLDEPFQREAVDAFGAVDRSAYEAAWATLAGFRAELSSLARAGGEDELDMLRFQVGELEAAELTAEDGTIADRHAAAAHAQEVIEQANAVTEALGGDRSASDLLVRLQPRFRDMARHLPAAAAWAEEAEDLTVRLQELSRTVADAVSSLDVGEEDLDALDARLTLVNRLLRKHRVSCVADLLALAEEKRSRLDALEHREERVAELQAKVAEAARAVREAGAALTAARRRAAARLAKAVTAELHGLGFLQAEFSVALEPIEPGAQGADRVVYLFGPNPGEAARPLAAIASSGEIARVMLALKVVTAAGDAASRTLVFDEVDANIGGEVGKAVGERLRAVARHHQVIAITHLPQTAVFGESHLVVSKAVSGGRTRAHVARVRGEERISEVARMLGGEKLTSVVRKHAQELLQLSR